MTGALRIAACAGLAAFVLAAGGCSTTIPSEEFIAKYGTDIDVPNPRCSRMPMRTYQGAKRGYYYIADRIPRCQGGGLIGKRINWRCAAYELPEGFPEAYRPGNVVFDGRKGTGRTYMIQSYVRPLRPTPAPATEPAKPEE